MLSGKNRYLEKKQKARNLEAIKAKEKKRLEMWIQQIQDILKNGAIECHFYYKHNSIRKTN